MRPLFWKEMRELRVWVAAAALLAGAVELLCRLEYFRSSWFGMFFPILMPLSMTVAAVGLAAGQIARERHARSLDYLLVRPVSPAAIVLAKFIAGTVGLTLLTMAIVSLGYVHPELALDTSLRAIQQHAGFQAMAFTVFPRYWSIYSLTLLVSVLLDRGAKVAGLVAVTVITMCVLAMYFEQSAPFSRLVYWLPFVDPSMGLVLAAKSAAISSFTGAVFGGVALLFAAIAARILRAERYAGNLGAIAIAASLVGASMLSAHVTQRKPTAPIASFEFSEEANAILANGIVVAVIESHGVRYLDFSQPGHPTEISFVPLPLWSTDSGWGSQRATMLGDAVFLGGHKKDLPVDQAELAIVKPYEAPREIALAPVRPNQVFSRPVSADQFVYVAMTRDEQSTLRVFDVVSRRELPSIPIKGRSPIELCVRGAYLYVDSMSALTAFDLADPANPKFVSATSIRHRFILGIPLSLTWQDDRLLALEAYPSSIEAFSLRDPAHPAGQTSLEYHNSNYLFGSGNRLYRPWQDGALEFRADGGELHAGRYLEAGRTVISVADGGALVFALTGSDQRDRRMVEAFR